MFQLLNRITWIVSISLGLILASIDNELIFIGIIAIPAVKYILFSPNYIKSRLVFFKTQLLKNENIDTNPLYNQDSEQSVSDNYSMNEVDTDKDDEKEFQSINNFQQADDKVVEETNYVASQEQKPTPSKPRELNVIEKFFSENLLAKVGGILIFLGVLFLLSLLYSIIGAVAKMCIGFAIGFSCYAAGVWLDKKGFLQESRIVMGVAILINYLVILSGRFLLGDDSTTDSSILSVGLTFAFLILNTVFSVVTALLYNSRALLIFGFIFAYINPLLLGESSSEPYTLLGYTMIVTLGALYMSYQRKDTVLFPLAFIFASIMFLIAPWSDGTGWLIKLLCINTLGVLSLYTSTVFQKTFQNISEILVGGIFFLIGIMGFLGIESISSLQMAIMGASSLGLMAFCYFSSNKGAYLYSIGTFGTILTLTPAIYTNGLETGVVGISAIIIALFGIMNIGFIVTKTKDVLADNLGNIISGLISGSIFLTYMIYFFGNEFFPGMIQGFIFFALACVYCLLSFFLVNKIGIDTMKSEKKYENTFYTIAAIGIGLFSLAVAFVFSEIKEIVSIIWLLEANVLFFLTSKTKSIKIAVGGLILFIIGIIKFIDYTSFGFFGETSFAGNYGMIVALCIILVSLIYNLVLLFDKKMSFLQIEFYGLHNLFHLIGIALIVITGHEILDISSQWNSLLYFSIAITALGALYDRIASKGLSNIHLIVYLALMAIHILLFADDIGTERLNLTISTIIAAIYALPYIYDIITRGTVKNKTLLTVFLSYAFILSTLYVYHIFSVTFAVTLYWGILSFILLSYGISKDILFLRTIGLYIISLTAAKVFLYDIWMSVDDTVSRVIALIVIGILMIILSTMYKKKYGNNLNSEFNPSNLFSKNTKNIQKIVPDTEQETVITKTQIQKDIENINIQGILGVRLNFNNEEKTVQIRAENLIKISKIIVNTYKKTSFQPGELKKTYHLIESDYKSSLSPTQYKKIRELVKKFVDQGGTIEFIK